MEMKTLWHSDFSRFEEEYLRATKEAEKIEAVLGGLTKKNQAQVRQHFCLSICSYFGWLWQIHAWWADQEKSGSGCFEKLVPDFKAK